MTPPSTLSVLATHVCAGVCDVMGGARPEERASVFAVVDVVVSVWCDPVWLTAFDTVVIGGQDIASAFPPLLVHLGLLPHEHLHHTAGSCGVLHMPGDLSAPRIHVAGDSPGVSIGYGVGVALGRQRYRLPGRVIVLVGDASLTERVSEDAMHFASQHRLTNLTVIVHRRTCHALEERESLLNPDVVDDGGGSSGWDIFYVDGHDFESLHRVGAAMWMPQRHLALVIARTAGGYGGDEHVPA